MKQSGISAGPWRAKARARKGKLTIGMDSGDRSSRYCVLDEQGGTILEGSVATTKERLNQVCGALPAAPPSPAMEIGYTAESDGKAERTVPVLRLGDEIDDFCVKCRRITNHSVVSMVGGDPAKVRCRTCYSDHDYRHQKAPPSKKDLKKEQLFKEVLSSIDPKAVRPEGE